jgi:hypothetical protein
VERSTIHIWTIHFYLVQLNFKLRLTKSKLALIEHNQSPDYVQLMFCLILVGSVRLG